jgi:hypothetical protein
MGSAADGTDAWDGAHSGEGKVGVADVGAPALAIAPGTKEPAEAPAAIPPATVAHAPPAMPPTTVSAATAPTAAQPSAMVPAIPATAPATSEIFLRSWACVWTWHFRFHQSRDLGVGAPPLSEFLAGCVAGGAAAAALVEAPPPPSASTIGRPTP